MWGVGVGHGTGSWAAGRLGLWWLPRDSSITHPSTGGITRVSEALEVIDKAAALDAATMAALASSGGPSQAESGKEEIEFRWGWGGRPFAAVPAVPCLAIGEP